MKYIVFPFILCLGLSVYANSTIPPEFKSADVNDDLIVSDLKLYQNYPNPFNPDTRIKFSIASETLRRAERDIFVLLKVYDAIGNEIATLVDEKKTAGVYEIDFNANKLTSGIYFYKLKAGSFSETKKMLLLR